MQVKFNLWPEEETNTGTVIVRRGKGDVKHVGQTMAMAEELILLTVLHFLNKRGFELILRRGDKDGQPFHAEQTYLRCPHEESTSPHIQLYFNPDQRRNLLRDWRDNKQVTLQLLGGIFLHGEQNEVRQTDWKEKIAYFAEKKGDGKVHCKFKTIPKSVSRNSLRLQASLEKMRKQGRTIGPYQPKDGPIKTAARYSRDALSAEMVNLLQAAKAVLDADTGIDSGDVSVEFSKLADSVIAVEHLLGEGLTDTERLFRYSAAPTLTRKSFSSQPQHDGAAPWCQACGSWHGSQASCVMHEEGVKLYQVEVLERATLRTIYKVPGLSLDVVKHRISEGTADHYSMQVEEGSIELIKIADEFEIPFEGETLPEKVTTEEVVQRLEPFVLATEQATEPFFSNAEHNTQPGFRDESKKVDEA